MKQMSGKSYARQMLLKQVLGGVVIRRADLERDWDALSALRWEAEKRVRAMGQETDVARGLDRMAGYVDRDQMYVLYIDRFLAACHALTDTGDPDFWWKHELRQPALYLDSVMVHPVYAHRQLGALVTGHAVHEARERGMTRLRLDCERGNEALRDHWAQLGFSYVRTITAPGRASGTLMEMRIE